LLAHGDEAMLPAHAWRAVSTHRPTCSHTETLSAFPFQGLNAIDKGEEQAPAALNEHRRKVNNEERF
jgi:hypothetical protein